MSLRDIEFQIDYRTGYNSIVDEFYRPALASSNAYWRSVGYFSSSALESFGTPLGEFIKNGGNIKLVTSVKLSRSDLEAIENGAQKQEICEARLEQIIGSEFSYEIGGGTLLLKRLLEIGRLEIQIAVPKDGTGIHHEKIGLFFDNEDYVAFSGSSNESRNAFENNRECIDVYPSWSSAVRAERKRSHFEKLWKHMDKGVEVYSFPDAARRKLIKVCDDWEERSGKAGKKIKTEPKMWDHQNEALRVFLSKEMGILNMATGTGKTHTALKIIQALHEHNSIDTVIVSTDGNDLLDQWHAELLNIRNTINANVYRHYKSWHEKENFLLNPKNAIFLVSRKPLASTLHELHRSFHQRTLLIHDEVHGLGSPANRNRLSGLTDNIRFRLGLSATPEREYDADGNKFLEEHIGPELMHFDLGSAIGKKILSPFNYFPLVYEQTAKDRQRIQDVYKQKAARDDAGNPMRDEKVWTQIAYVHKTSEAKLPVFDRFIQQKQYLLKRCIIFVETKDYGHQVLDIVHKYRSDFHTYFSGEESETLKHFAKGELECLITCHRVSEGINIQSLSSVILFSSARARLETIQRMGRCLRTDPNDPKKVANVVDFMRRSEKDSDQSSDETRVEWLRELSSIRPA